MSWSEPVWIRSRLSIFIRMQTRLDPIAMNRIFEAWSFLHFQNIIRCRRRMGGYKPTRGYVRRHSVQSDERQIRSGVDEPCLQGAHEMLLRGNGDRRSEESVGQDVQRVCGEGVYSAQRQRYVSWSLNSILVRRPGTVFTQSFRIFGSLKDSQYFFFVCACLLTA